MNSPLDNPIEFLEETLTRILPLIDASRRRDSFIAAAIIGAMASGDYGHVSNVAKHAIAVADAAIAQLDLEGRAPA